MIFFDMDGTIAKFYKDEDCLEKMYEKGFFLSLEPYALAKFVNELANLYPQHIGILSACVESPYCEDEKRAWLHTHCPNVLPQNFIFTKAGENKAKAVESWKQYQETMILIDDYSENLYNWQMFDRTFVAIKFINGINNKSGKTYQHSFRTVKQLKELLKQFGYMK